MSYVRRQIEIVLARALKSFPAVLVTGPRQSGKTTLLRETMPASTGFVSLEVTDHRLWAQQDPRDFLENHPPPVIIDEVQYVPDLLPYIKRRIDDNRSPGQWLITGSQQFQMMKNVSESLAGRIAVLSLLPFSLSERRGELFESWEKWRESWFQNNDDSMNAAACVQRGFYPELLVNSDIDTRLWYDSYTRTYLERDVRAIANIGQLDVFHRFLSLLAARTSSIMNFSTYAGELGVSVPTIKHWLSVLEASYILFKLPAWHGNPGKRITRASKYYFIDIGLAVYLAGINDPEVLMKSALGGLFFENLVAADIYKQWLHFSENISLYYINYRKLWEIDLLVEENRCFTPIEIKMAATITQQHLKNFPRLRTALEKSNSISEAQYLICKAPAYYKRQNTHIVPWKNL